MNWTGGKLRQHSRKDQSSTLHRQKQHFARVRQQLQEPRQTRSPFKPSFFDSDEMSPPRQTRLDDFTNTAPLARKLASLSSNECNPEEAAASHQRPRHRREATHTNQSIASSSKRKRSGGEEREVHSQPLFLASLTLSLGAESKTVKQHDK